MELLEVLVDGNWSFEVGFVSVTGLSDLKLANRYINFLTYAHGHFIYVANSFENGKIS